MNCEGCEFVRFFFFEGNGCEGVVLEREGGFGWGKGEG